MQKNSLSNKLDQYYLSVDAPMLGALGPAEQQLIELICKFMTAVLASWVTIRELIELLTKKRDVSTAK